MRFHESYRKHVLMPDFNFAKKHLARHFLDAMTAHVRTVKQLDNANVKANQETIERLLAAINELRYEDPPDYNSEVPDMYFAFNQKLESRLGKEAVSFLRMALSRNDLDMTVYKMRTRELTLAVLQYVCLLRQALLEQAQAHTTTLLIAQTHHQPGQPTTVGHYLAAIDNVIARHIKKLFASYSDLNTCPLGAAALAGSSHALNRQFTAEQLGFNAPVSNTYEAVAASDWQVDFVTNLQSLALTLSRFTHDLISWASAGLFDLSDALVQGSSIMPQKRNPVALEHARTHFSRTLGSAQMVVFSSHNIPFADLNDFGPDIQGALRSQFVQLEGGLELLTACLEEGQFSVAKLEQEAFASDTTATELADELTRHYQLSFQEGHHLAAALVQKLSKEGRLLREARPQDLLDLGGPEVDAQVLKDAIDPVKFVERRHGLGGPAPTVVEAHLVRAVLEHDENVDTLTQLHSKLVEAHENLTMPRKEKV